CPARRPPLADRRRRSIAAPSRSGATRSPSSAGLARPPRRDRVCRSWLTPLRLEVALPHIQVDALALLRRVAPQLGSLEAYAVKRLGLLSLAVGVGVRKDVRAVDAAHDSALAADIARQASVAGR